MAGSVMMVAGFELASTTRNFSSARTRQAWVPGVVELARLPDHDRARADDQDRLDVVAPGHQRPPPECRPGAGGVHQLPELLEQVAGIVGAGTGLGVVLHAEHRGVPAAESLDDPVVEIDVGDLGTVQ